MIELEKKNELPSHSCTQDICDILTYDYNAVYAGEKCVITVKFIVRRLIIRPGLLNLKLL
jgi:hypothetical protein